MLHINPHKYLTTLGLFVKNVQQHSNHFEEHKLLHFFAAYDSLLYLSQKCFLEISPGIPSNVVSDEISFKKSIDRITPGAKETHSSTLFFRYRLCTVIFIRHSGLEPRSEYSLKRHPSSPQN